MVLLQFCKTKKWKPHNLQKKKKDCCLLIRFIHFLNFWEIYQKGFTKTYKWTLLIAISFSLKETVLNLIIQKVLKE